MVTSWMTPLLNSHLSNSPAPAAELRQVEPNNSKGCCGSACLFLWLEPKGTRDEQGINGSCKGKANGTPGQDDSLEGAM
jgi:hypothetical protein